MQEALKFIFTLPDKKVSHDPTNLIFIFGAEESSDCSIIYNPNNNDFDCYCADLKTQDNDFIVTCGVKNDFGYVLADTGVSGTISLEITSRLFGYTGQSGYLNLEYHPHAKLNLKSSIGIHGETNVQRNIRLYPYANTGYQASLSLKTQPAIYLNDVYSDFGVSGAIDIKISERKRLDFEGYVGYVGYTNFNRSPSLVLHGKYGLNATLNITSKVNLYFKGYVGTQSNLVIDYRKPFLISLDAYTGQVGNVIVASSSILIFNAFVGSTGQLDIYVSPAKSIKLKAYTGYVGNFDIVNSAIFKLSASVGYSTYLNLQENKPYSPKLNAYYGIDGSVKITDSIGLLLESHVGIDGFINNIDTLPFIMADVGIRGDLNLATNTTLDINAHVGYDTNLILNYYPSEPLGDFITKTGQTGDLIISTQVSTDFKLRGYVGLYNYLGIFESFNIDLNTTSCCPIRKYHLHHVNLSREKDIGVRYDVPKWLDARVSLQTNALMDFNAHVGVEAHVKEYDNYLSFNGYVGSSGKIVDLHNDFIIDLTYGNTTYDDKFIFETNKPYTQYKTPKWITKTGVTGNINLGVSHNMWGIGAVGVNGSITLKYDAAFVFRAHVGFEGDFTLNTNIKINNSRAYVGFDGSLNFYEPPLLAYVGVEGTFDLMMEYDVEFIDDGCLLNNHIPVNENGTPIIDATNEMAIEGRYYSRFIRGRCF